MNKEKMKVQLEEAQKKFLEKRSLESENELYSAAAPLYYSVKKKYGAMLEACGMDSDDIYQVAMTGVWRAAEEYDPSKGRFCTYCYNHMMYALQHAVETSGYKNIHIPAPEKRWAQKTAKKMGSSLGDPNLLSLARHYLSIDDVKRLEKVTFLSFNNSLDEVSPETGESTYAHIESPLPTPEELVVGKTSAMTIALTTALTSALTSEEKQAVLLRFGFDGNGTKTLSEVAEIMHLKAPSTVHFHIEKALKKLRRNELLTSLIG